MAEDFKILVIDIETRPSLAYVWNVWDENIQPDRLLYEKDVLSFAAKWVGKKKVHFKSVYHDSKREMVEEAWKLLDEADAVVHYNGKKFDVPHLNLEFLRAELGPPSPYRQLDLLQTVRSEFNFTHNKLDHVATQLNIGQKISHAGFSLWRECMEGSSTAWKQMKEYNIHDTELTEELYHKLLPWIKNHPSFAVLYGKECCTNCGSDELILNGFHYTKTGRYQRLKCKVCGKHMRHTKRESGASITETTSW